MHRLLFLLPSLISLIVAIIFAVSGDGLKFVLWLFTAAFFFIMFWPLMGKITKEHTPTFQVFATLLVFAFLFICVSYFEFIRLGLSQIEAVGYGIVLGIAVVALIMLLKGK